MVETSLPFRFGTTVLPLRNNLEVRCALLGLHHYNIAYFTCFPWSSRLYDIPGIRYVGEDMSSRLERKWRVAPMVEQAREADCKALACYRSGELVAKDGIPAEPLLLEFPNLLHIIVKYLFEGRVCFEDPSLKLGMPAPPGYAQAMERLSF